METNKRKLQSLESVVEMPVYQTLDYKTKKFKEYLKNRKYRGAYNALLKSNYFPNSEEIFELVNGLRNSSQLNKKMGDKLRDYINQRK